MATTAPQPGMWDDGGALPPEDQTYGGGDQGAGDGDNKASPASAGYMELGNAQKSGDCELVNVPNGVSGDAGCCDLFSTPDVTTDQDGVMHATGATEFQCGQCVHFTGQGGQQPEAEPEQGGEETPAGNSWAGAPQGQGGQWS